MFRAKSLLIFSPHGLPLSTDASEKTAKYLFPDIGLMQRSCGITTRELLSGADLLGTYRGALAEQFVGQELLSSSTGPANPKLYYWSRDKRNSAAEVDYLLVKQGKVIPVEVKSGPSGKLKSLNIFQTEHPNCGEALVISSANLSILPEKKLKFLPLYSRLNR